jgi:hypothetical protein
MIRRVTIRASVLVATFVVEVHACVDARLVTGRLRPAKTMPEAPRACALTPEPS